MRPTVEERTAHGVAARDRVPPAAHAGWAPGADRRDPVEVIGEQDARRDADLVPVRHGRMMASPFTFYRGAAAVMAADLAGSPTAGLQVQLCGDAHLSNFGAFGSPERRLVFDVNDFDETLPGPFEYDVKRLAASLTVAAGHNGLSGSEAGQVTTATVASYRRAMGQFSQMGALEVWYAHVSEGELSRAVDQLTSGMGKGQRKKLRRRYEKNVRKAHSRSHLQAMSKLTEVVDGRRRIVSDPPVLVPGREIGATYGIDADALEAVLRDQLTQYRSSLPADRQALLDRFEMVDWARKVVGVGSVGTRAFVALMQGRDEQDPLFLQVKEATSSVLEGPLPGSRYEQPGERVVQGQRLMQAASDIFLGWSRGFEAGRFYYWRQLRDMKGSALVELMGLEDLASYGGLCGWTLARAHARSGDPVAIAAYLGDDDSFDLSVTDFARRYADQNQRDFDAFTAAVRSSRIDALVGV